MKAPSKKERIEKMKQLELSMMAAEQRLFAAPSRAAHLRFNAAKREFAAAVEKLTKGSK